MHGIQEEIKVGSVAVRFLVEGEQSAGSVALFEHHRSKEIERSPGATFSGETTKIRLVVNRGAKEGSAALSGSLCRSPPVPPALSG
jgi:hypothetical protein